MSGPPYQWSVFVVDLDPAVGSEQAGRRPVLIVSREVANVDIHRSIVHAERDPRSRPPLKRSVWLHPLYQQAYLGEDIEVHRRVVKLEQELLGQVTVEIGGV